MATMSDAVRAQAAIDMLVAAYNPHQRRGPDGRWIRMPTSELKRPRRRPKRTPASKRAPQVTGGDTPPINLPDPEADYREKRDEYNAQAMFYAESRQDENRIRGVPDPSLDYNIDAVKAATDQDSRDRAVDRLRELLDAWHGARYLLDPAPERLDTPLPTLPPGPRTDGGPRPPTFAPYERRHAALDNSVRSGIDGQDILGGGIMGDTRRFLLVDGTQAIYKRAKADWVGWSTKDQTDAEELAALLGAELGVRVPAVQRASDDELYMEVLPGQPGHVRARESGDLSPEQLRADDAKKIGLLDVLTDNPDRHGGNWLEDGDDLYAIDHGLAFKGARTGRSSATISPFATANYIDTSGDYRDRVPLNAADIGYVRDALSRVEPRFRELDHMQWLDRVRERLDNLAQRTSDTEGLYR